MTTSRLLLLLVVLGVGLGSVFFLPKTVGSQPAGIRLELPEYVGKWYGVDQEITQRERDTLAADTQFARKLYTDGLGNSVYVSIVMSGNDLDNSIHRPERCLPAQGWTVADSRKVAVPVTDGKLQVTRLHNVRQIPTKVGTMVPIYNLSYYWFVGHDEVTASHFERTFIDIKDRVLHGYNQRWAYITVGAEVTEGLVRFGRSEKATDEMIRDFIEKLYPTISSPGAAVSSAAVAKTSPPQPRA